MSLSVLRPTAIFCAHFSALVAVLLLSGCSVGVHPSPSLYDRLSGRGPVLVAKENQYLPANRLLSEHVKSSEAFREQIAMMGQPDALSVERELFATTQVVLYYSALDQQVAFIKQGSEWLREPASLIDPEARAHILAEADHGVASVAAADEGSTAVLPLIAEAPIEFKARMSPDLLAGRTAGFTRLRSGDFRHKVTFKGETLALIAEWYSGKSSYAPHLAKASHRPLSRTLMRGDSIIIPRHLMRNPVAFPEAALR
jgi:hypothetical protein